MTIIVGFWGFIGLSFNCSLLCLTLIPLQWAMALRRNHQIVLCRKLVICGKRSSFNEHFKMQSEE
jgi:hypothetical protein